MAAWLVHFSGRSTEQQLCVSWPMPFGCMMVRGWVYCRGDAWGKPFTVWKLAHVAKGIKSKNFAKHDSILDNRVPIERYDTHQCFDTRSNDFIFIVLNASALNGSNQIWQKGTIKTLRKDMHLKIQIFHNFAHKYHPIPI